MGRKIWISVELVALAMMTIGFEGTALPVGSTIVDQRDDQRQADEVIRIKPAMTKDYKLAQAIWNTLRGVPALSSNDTLRVNVKNAVVKLEGSVEYPVQKEAAEKAAASVPGVTTVINLIEVKNGASRESVAQP